MIFTLGSQVKWAIQVWNEETQHGMRSETLPPVKNAPHYRTVPERAPKGGWRSVQVPIVQDEPVIRRVADIARLQHDAPSLALGGGRPPGRGGHPAVERLTDSPCMLKITAGQQDKLLGLSVKGRLQE